MYFNLFIDSAAKHLQLLSSHAGHNGDSISIISRIVFPNDGKTRSVTSFVVHFDEENVSPKRQLATGNRNDFSIVNSVPEKERYTASFESLPGGDSIYNLTISPLLYKDDMVKLEAVLFFDENGQFMNEQTHTVLLVRGMHFNPIKCHIVGFVDVTMVYHYEIAKFCTDIL